MIDRCTQYAQNLVFSWNLLKGLAKHRTHFEGSDMHPYMVYQYHARWIRWLSSSASRSRAPRDASTPFFRSKSWKSESVDANPRTCCFTNFERERDRHDEVLNCGFEVLGLIGRWRLPHPNVKILQNNSGLDEIIAFWCFLFFWQLQQLL